MREYMVVVAVRTLAHSKKDAIQYVDKKLKGSGIKGARIMYTELRDVMHSELKDAVKNDSF
jgi:hypothetical protein